MNAGINNNTKPLLLIGSNSALMFLIEVCEQHNIIIAGIIDSDYYGNTTELEGLTVVDTEESLHDPAILENYKKNYNFFLATNWLSDTDAVSSRNRNKRNNLIRLIDQFEIPCISLVDKDARVHKTNQIGKNVFIDALCYISPKNTIGDYTSIFAATMIGYNNTIGRSCVFQRHSGIMHNNIVEDNVYVGLHSQASCSGLVIRKGTVVHPCLMIRRDTQENEVISLVGKDLRKIYQLYRES